MRRMLSRDHCPRQSNPSANGLRCQQRHTMPIAALSESTRFLSDPCSALSRLRPSQPENACIGRNAGHYRIMPTARMRVKQPMQQCAVDTGQTATIQMPVGKRRRHHPMLLATIQVMQCKLVLSPRHSPAMPSPHLAQGSNAAARPIRRMSGLAALCGPGSVDAGLLMQERVLQSW